MEMALRQDHVNGDLIRFPIYEFDYEKLKLDQPEAIVDPTTPSSVLTNGVITVGTGDGSVRYQKMEVTTETLKNYLPDDIPVQLEQYGIPDTISGAICPINTNMRDSNTSPYITTYGYLTEITAAPTDLDTDPHYIHGAIRDLYGTYASSMRPIYPYAIRDTWTDATTEIKNYYDQKHIMLKVLYTGVGSCHISAFKSCVSFIGYHDYDGQFAGVGTPPTDNQDWENMSSQHKTYYGICNSHNICLNDLGLDQSKCCYYRKLGSNDASYWRNQNFYQFFVHYTINGEDMYGIACCLYSRRWGTDVHPYDMIIVALGSDFWGASVTPDTGNWGEETKTGGGKGVWTFPSDSRGDRTGDDLAAEVTARRTALQAFFNVPNGFQLHQLLSDDIQHIFALLYDDNFISRYTTSIYNPLSAVLSLHLLPQRLVDLSETTTPLTLSGYSISSNLPTPKNFPIVATLKTEHIGDVDLDATDTFIDYAPYTRAYLHLPYIGVMDIDINAIAAGTISVDYITDATTGNCAAFVWCSDRDGVHTYKYIATGNAAYTMPMFAAQQDGAAVGKIVNSTLGLAMSAISGNAAGAISAAGGIAGGIFDAATTQRNTQVTGSFSGNASLISDTVCWLELVRPVWAEPKHFQMLDGLPSMLSGTIAAFTAYGDAYSGYLRVVDLETDGIQAAQDELTEIETLLRSGIFINDQ